MADMPTYQSTLTGPELDEALRNIGNVEGAVQEAEAAAAQAKQWAESIDQTDIARAVVYTVDVPTTGWTAGSLTWAGTTYTRQCTVQAAQATASPDAVTMSYAGGDYDAYCQVGCLDTQDGSVVLWATADPTAACQIQVVEVMTGEQSGD